MEKLFWSQSLAPEHPVPLSDHLKQWTELHRVAELAMRDLIIRLWLAEPMPSSYFGLFKRLVSAVGVKTGGSRVGGPDLCVLG